MQLAPVWRPVEKHIVSSGIPALSPSPCHIFSTHENLGLLVEWLWREVGMPEAVSCESQG